MKKSAFTLAEVLITLTIIGVVAALSIPTLLSSSNATADVTQLKKSYATFSNAVKLYEANNGSLTTAFSGNGDAASNEVALNELATFLNIIKNCGNTKGCWYDSPLKTLGGSVASGFDEYDTYMQTNGTARAILADGTMIGINDYSGACTTDNGDGPLNGEVCASVRFDINGSKGPNQSGRDYFLFWITKSGVFPMGSYNDNQTCETDSTTWTTSDGCAAKVLTEGAINY